MAYIDRSLIMKKQPGWALPNLKDAQVRTTKEAVIEKSLFQIPEQIRLLGQGKKYYLRTYGCQANERDWRAFWRR